MISSRLPQNLSIRKQKATDNLSRLPKILQPGIQFFQAFFRNGRVRTAVNVLVFGFCFYYLFENLQSIEKELRNLHFNWYLISMAFLLTWFVDWIGGLSWWLLLRGFGQKVGFQASMEIHFRSAIAKYVPGFVWQYVGKIYLTAEMGVPASITGRVLVWEFIQPVWTGFATSLFFAPDDLLFRWGLQSWVPVTFHFLGILLLMIWFVFVITAPRLFSLSIFGYSPTNPISLFLSALVVSIGWALLGISLWLGTLAFGGYGIDIPFSIFVFTVSMVIGILVIPVPNGLGIREGISSALLVFFVPLPIALLISSVSRLQLVIGDFICLLLTWFFHRISRQRDDEKCF